MSLIANSLLLGWVATQAPSTSPGAVDAVPSPAPTTADEVAPSRTERIGRSVYMLAIYDGDRVAGNGSGFAITADGVLATNHHVVEGIHGDLTAVSRDGARLPVLGILADDEDHDIALVKIDAVTVPLALAPEETVIAGQRVHMVSAAMGLEQSYSSGVIAAVRETLPKGMEGDRRWKGPFVQHTATSSPGSSGAPVVDDEDRVVAVHHSGITGEGIRFGAHVSLLRTLIAATDLHGPLRPLGPNVQRNLLISGVVFGVPALIALLAGALGRRRRARADARRRHDIH